MVKKSSSKDTTGKQPAATGDAKSTTQRNASESTVKKRAGSEKPATPQASEATTKSSAKPASSAAKAEAPKASRQTPAAQSNGKKAAKTVTAAEKSKSPAPTSPVESPASPVIAEVAAELAATMPEESESFVSAAKAEKPAISVSAPVEPAAPTTEDLQAAAAETTATAEPATPPCAAAISAEPTATPVKEAAAEAYHEPEMPIIMPLETSEAEPEAESLELPIPEKQHPDDIAAAETVQVVETPTYQPPGPQYQSMFIVQITPELAPLAKVGGLADVVTGLSRELEWRGNTVEIILPKYDCMRYDHIWGLCKTYDDLWVPWFGGHIHCTVWFGFVFDRKCFFIEPHSQDQFFNRGSIYGFNDDILRFAFFSRAALEFLYKSGKNPDIIHCHDWQTALVPVFMYEIYQHIGMHHPRVCFTIHNFKHQGTTGDFILRATGLNRPEYYFNRDRLLDNHIPHALNLMKGGIVYSNFVTTVSPRYAGETKDGGQGFGLEPTLHTHHYKYGGVVNGIDYDSWNPETDPHIPVHYNADTIEGKYANKNALRHRLLLADNAKPIVAFVGRLDPQKGLDLIRHALFYALNNNAQFVLLGSSPESSINNYFWELKRHLNDSPDCHIEVGFDEELAHLIYAGSDMIIVPSLFEPCGLTQLIAMQYGTIPIVRAVGGLADTVFDKDYAHDKPLHERNGYVFRDYNNAGLESALSRAIACYYQFPEHFRDLMKNAMHCDYSWKYPGQHYLNIYEYIRDK